MHSHYTPKDAARFWAKVDTSGDCWMWAGARLKSGYGVFFRGRDHKPPNQAAHRASYELHYGVIPVGLFVCHQCDNPSCVNPAHLFLGTHKANMQDMRSKGRSLYGERGSASKLSEQQVLEIYNRYARDEGTQKELAAAFGVSASDVCLIVTGRYWRHLKLPPIPQKRQGCYAPGEASSRAKLTDGKVRAIRAAYASGAREKDLALQYEVTYVNIRNIIRRKTWRHI